MSKLLILIFLFISTRLFADTGVLILAHGSTHGQHDGHHHCHQETFPDWEKNVLNIIEEAQKNIKYKTQVSFGMWETECIDHAIDMLEAKMSPNKLDHLIVVPFYISSYSSVIEMQKYIFGLRADKPLPIPVKKSKFNKKVSYTQSIDYSDSVSNILKDRAEQLFTKSKTQTKDNQELYLIMHGPNENISNHRWLEMGQRYASDLSIIGFKDVKVISIRDDIDEPLKSEIEEDLRESIKTTIKRKREVLLLPLLLSTNGIQDRILKRVEGLNVVWDGQALAPDLRLAKIIIDRINSSK